MRGQLGQLLPRFLSVDDTKGPSDLTTERGFDSHLATWVIDELSLSVDMLSIGVCVQPVTPRSPVDWCRNKMSVVYGASTRCNWPCAVRCDYHYRKWRRQEKL